MKFGQFRALKFFVFMKMCRKYCNRKHQIALCGELALAETVDLSLSALYTLS